MKNASKKISNFVGWVMNGNEFESGVTTVIRYSITPFVIIFIGIFYLIGFRECEKCGKIMHPFKKRFYHTTYFQSYGSWFGGGSYSYYMCSKCILQIDKETE